MLKRISFKIAKIIKDAGYPQKYNIGDSWCYENGQYPDENELQPPISGWILLPTYLEVGLWLWREKELEFSLDYDKDFKSWYCWIKRLYVPMSGNDPEEALIAAIEHLITNDLVK